MTLEERLAVKEKQNSIVGEATTVFIKGEGASREFTYVPKDARKKADLETEPSDSKKRRRDRRGVKDLGFKTPFKNNT